MLYKKFILGTIIAGGASFMLVLLPGKTISYNGALHASTENIQANRESLPPFSYSYSSVVIADTERILDTKIVETPRNFHEVSEENVVIKEEVKGEVTETDEEIKKVKEGVEKTVPVFEVPFYSQLNDITSTQWKKVGCGIASLAMIIEFHKPKTLASVDTLLQEGIDAGAYLTNAGWTYAGLISVSKKYKLDGTTHDFGGMNVDTAFEALEKAVARGPVMASVHYTFVPTNPIPHLVVVNGIKGDTLYYNDPAEPSGGGSISVTQFKSAWKKRYIEFYPVS